MPTPWNSETKLMHVAVKGFELPQAQRPKSNLVFLVDTSGSMDAPNKLPLVKASLKLLLDRLGTDDTVGIVAYAGEAGVALEPTSVSDRAKITEAIDRLGAGGSTAGAAGIEEAYRLAGSAFAKDGVNRVMLATDGDFNVGPSDDEALKRMIEERRRSGIFLSVLGFGEGNYNDGLMQVLAQNGNGTAAYIDTLAEAEKTLVQEATANLFPIAKDVKIQVEFNPQAISEYRLIGYESRMLSREDFNNDRVDAGEIGSGHSVTAIYEIVPVGSASASVDRLRYAKPQSNASAGDAPVSGNANELAFVRIRYKQPDGEKSALIEQPVMAATALGDVEAAPQDVRFSVAVAAFGQKLRNIDSLAGFGHDRILELAQGARGSDPFGYRAGFLTLVRLAKGLEGGR
jgi:Ca-activated chloride channel homolog